jgi:hypothetical protein
LGPTSYSLPFTLLSFMDGTLALSNRRSPCRAQSVGGRTKITILQSESLSLLIVFRSWLTW